MRHANHPIRRPDRGGRPDGGPGFGADREEAGPDAGDQARDDQGRRDPAGGATRGPSRAARRVYVPPPPVVELDESAVVAGLPTVLDNETRDRYRRIFQAQQSGNWAQADEDIRQLEDKTLMGYVGAQRLLSPNNQARYDQLAAWLQEYNDHPDAPAIYRLALARRTPGGPN